MRWSGAAGAWLRLRAVPACRARVHLDRVRYGALGVCAADAAAARYTSPVTPSQPPRPLQMCLLPFPPHTSGGKLLRRLSNFQKTVSCVRLSPFAGPESAAAPRLLAGSLDGHVKVRCTQRMCPGGCVPVHGA